MKVMCPNCGKPLRLISYDYHCDVGIYHCAECLNDIDSDWEVTFTEEGEIKEIERYYIG